MLEDKAVASSRSRVLELQSVTRNGQQSHQARPWLTRSHHTGCFLPKCAPRQSALQVGTGPAAELLSCLGSTGPVLLGKPQVTA